jgi:tetratricopeptide (TPR) repeat protein
VKRTPVARQERRADYWWLGIPVVVFLAYLPALQGGPLWDDFGHITVPELRSLEGLWRIWSELGATQQYYPLLHSAFWIEHRLWGDSFVGYHLANVALHSTSAVLLVLILRRLAVPGALLAGLIFALHPVAVESVAWISEQKNTLSAVFYLASAYVYLRFHETGLKPCATDRTGLKPRATKAAVSQPWPTAVAQPFRAVDYWLSFGLFLCALLSKTVTATLPAALLLVFWWQRGRLSWRRDVMPLLPWFAVAIAAGLVTAWIERDVIGARGADFDLTLVERVLLAGRIIWFYLSKLIWPADLMFWYPRWGVDTSAWWQYVFPTAVVGLAIGLGIIARRNRSPLAGLLFLCGTLFPVLGFFNVYPFRFSYVADHFQYLAGLGIIVPVASGLAMMTDALPPVRRRAMQAACAVIIAALAILTWRQSAMYTDAETLYRESIARNPGAWIAYQNLGTLLVHQDGRVPEAIAAYRTALTIRPGHVELKNNLVMAHIKAASMSPQDPGGTTAAIAHLREALRIDPNATEAHYVLANVLAVAGTPERVDEAIAHYENVLRMRPDHFRAHYNLGTVLMDVDGRQADAIAHLEAALKLQPDNTETRVNLGMALVDVPGRRGEAVHHLEFALAKRPDLAPVREVLEGLRSTNEAGTPKKE